MTKAKEIKYIYELCNCVQLIILNATILMMSDICRRLAAQLQHHYYLPESTRHAIKASKTCEILDNTRCFGAIRATKRWQSVHQINVRYEDLLSKTLQSITAEIYR